jgi:hypothetical protein
MVADRVPTLRITTSATGTADDGRDHNHAPADDDTAAVDAADDYPADDTTHDDATAAEYDVQAEYDESVQAAGNHPDVCQRTVAHIADAAAVQPGTATGSAADKRTRLDTSCRAGCNVGPSGEHSGTIAGVAVQSAGGHDDHP